MIKDLMLVISAMVMGAVIILLLFEYQKPNDFQYLSLVEPSKQCANKSLEDFRQIEVWHKTGSMRPYMYHFDKVLVVDYDPNVPLVLGDVVANGKFMHRIVSINHRDQSYQTKGDNARTKDSYVTAFNETKFVVCGVLRG